MAPEGLNVDIIGDDLKERFPDIEELYNVHLWTITTDMLVFSAHVKLKDSQNGPVDQERLVSRINEYLAEEYDVIESTIQITSEADVCNVTWVSGRDDG